jgi:hypothetical protein
MLGRRWSPRATASFITTSGNVSNLQQNTDEMQHADVKTANMAVSQKCVKVSGICCCHARGDGKLPGFEQYSSEQPNPNDSVRDMASIQAIQ